MPIASMGMAVNVSTVPSHRRQVRLNRLQIVAERVRLVLSNESLVWLVVSYLRSLYLSLKVTPTRRDKPHFSSKVFGEDLAGLSFNQTFTRIDKTHIQFFFQLVLLQHLFLSLKFLK